MTYKLLCFVCDGSGYTYKWKDRDPIEGYKLAPRHNCDFCSTMGYICSTDIRYEAVKVYWSTYKTSIDKKRAETKALKEKKDKLIASGLKKLTKAEKEALGL